VSEAPGPVASEPLRRLGLDSCDAAELAVMAASERLLAPLLAELERLDLSAVGVDAWSGYGEAPR
jgi:hypothetical protein